MLRDPKNPRPPGLPERFVRERHPLPGDPVRWSPRHRQDLPVPEGSSDGITGSLPRAPFDDDSSTMRDSVIPRMTLPLAPNAAESDVPTPFIGRPPVEPELDWADSETLTEVYHARKDFPQQQAPQPVAPPPSQGAFARGRLAPDSADDPTAPRLPAVPLPRPATARSFMRSSTEIMQPVPPPPPPSAPWPATRRGIQSPVSPLPPPPPRAEPSVPEAPGGTQPIYAGAAASPPLNRTLPGTAPPFVRTLPGTAPPLNRTLPLNVTDPAAYDRAYHGNAPMPGSRPPSPPDYAAAVAQHARPFSAPMPSPHPPPVAVAPPPSSGPFAPAPLTARSPYVPAYDPRVSGVARPPATPVPPPFSYGPTQTIPPPAFPGVAGPAPGSLRPPFAPAVKTPAQSASLLGKLGMLLAGIALAMATALTVLLLLPRKGQLRIEVGAASGAPVERAEIFVDGRKECDTAPCLVPGLAPGPKTIKVIAPSFDGDPVTAVVESRKERLVVVTLRPVDAQATTELHIASAQNGVTLSIDGKSRGPLPLVLTDVPPGPHRFRFDAGPRFEASEQPIDVASGPPRDVAAPPLKVKKGRIVVQAPAPKNARVLLVRKDSKAVQKVLAGPWPMTVDDLEADRWRIVASAPGFQDLTQDVAFADGNAELAMAIDLSANAVASNAAAGHSHPAAPDPAPPRAAATPPAKPARDDAADDDAKADMPSGTGLLNLNSLPPAKVLLDGHPLGSTPKTDVSVPAGTHTVTFIHPDLGKKVTTVTVKAGQTTTAAVRFDK